MVEHLRSPLPTSVHQYFARNPVLPSLPAILPPNQDLPPLPAILPTPLPQEREVSRETMPNPQYGQPESSAFATSGLSRVLDGLGRTRGSSATPEVFSPTPNRGGFQNPLDSMNPRFNQDSNPNYNMSPNTNWSGSSSMAQGTPVHNRHTSNSTHMSSQSQGQGFTGSGTSQTVFSFPVRQGQGQGQSQSGPSVPPVSTTHPRTKSDKFCPNALY
jgi:hypothetical protein